ncbi:MAG: PEP-CTERM sorting domain-containing protein [Denitromonas halophila]|nr:MAG: PEP-CTERM sorting domain-containing protein [Denitromonas halophila]TVT69121.1 MAG: PEP-CTERM sorting domain-containing protein [Denitromonas halophila]
MLTFWGFLLPVGLAMNVLCAARPLPAIGRVGLCVSVLSICLAAPVASAAVSYTVTPIASGFIATDINDAGWVAGTSIGSNYRASLWSSGSGMLDLGQLVGATPNSMALGINNDNRVVGAGVSGSTRIPRTDLEWTDDAFQWTRDTGMQYLNTSSPQVSSLAAAINDQNQIAGTVNHGGTRVAAITTPDGTQRLLGTLTGGSDYSGWTGFSSASAINAGGDVVGTGRSVSGGNHAFLWTEAGGMQDLGFLPGAYENSRATGINDARQVIGWSQGDDCWCAFLWSATDGMQSLGHLSGAATGYESSFASDINNAGQVIGWSYVGDVAHAMRWTETAGMQDLNALIDPAEGWVLSSANGINEKGQIVGTGLLNGQSYGFVLSPVPEPATWAMMLGGLGVLFRRRRSVAA